MIALFERFTIEMTRAQAESVSHSGECFEDCKELLTIPKIKRELKKITEEDLKAELKEYGAWNKEELEDRSDNELRIIWIAGCNIIEELYINKRR